MKIGRANLDEADKLRRAFREKSERSGWMLGDRFMPSATLTFRDLWQQFEGAVFERADFEKLIFEYVRENLWFRDWLSMMNTSPDDSFELWFSKPSIDDFPGLIALARYITEESIKEIAWKKGADRKLYGLRVDFVAAINLAMAKLNFVSPSGQEMKKLARDLVEKDRDYLRRWIDLTEGRGKATAYGINLAALAVLWDLFLIPVRFFSDRAAAGLMSEIRGQDTPVSIYQDSLRGRHGLKLPRVKTALVKGWDNRFTRPAGKLSVWISRSGSKARGLNVEHLAAMISKRFPDRKIEIR